MLKYHIALLGGFDTICNNPEKTLATIALQSQKD
jgi:hypothetical protein